LLIQLPIARAGFPSADDADGVPARRPDNHVEGGIDPADGDAPALAVDAVSSTVIDVSQSSRSTMPNENPRRATFCASFVGSHSSRII
jgi:hypothetical protein